MTQLPAATHIGPVGLTVRSFETSIPFYTDLIGLSVLDQADGAVQLGAGARHLVTLFEAPDARRVPRATGLYHMALRVPDRHALAQAILRIARAEYPVQGASDHLVSEALYLADPDGHGIEIYRDRPRDAWPYQNGQLQMDTLALNLDPIMGTLAGEEDTGDGMPADTDMGHVHLQISDVTAARGFYVDVVGFDEMLMYGTGALFVSAGGYHHHLGLNTWHSLGAAPAGENTLGLQWFTVNLPGDAARDAVLARAEDIGAPLTERDGLPTIGDPSGLMMRLDVQA